jgi:DNA-binding transcriptional LysR family regulator
MDLKRLHHLVVLADLKNFCRAAEKCHLSQSAFSRSVQAAEEELGLQLFDRGTLEVRCTDAGEFVVARARKLVFESRCLDRDVSLYRERLIGDLALGVGPYPAATMIPSLLTDLRTRFAGVKVRVEVNNASYLAEHLRAEELDFYIADRRNIDATSDFDVTLIGRLSGGFYVRSGHPLLSSPTVNGPDLMPYGLASVRVPEVILRLLAPVMGFPDGTLLPLALECDDLNLLKTVAMNTDTVLACADTATTQEVETAKLFRLVVAGLPPMFSDMGVVSLKGRSFSPMAQFAVDFLMSWGEQQADA